MGESLPDGWWRPVVTTVGLAIVIGFGTATIDLYKRVAVLESGPRGSEIITRLVTIETQLLGIRQQLEDNRDERRTRD